MNKLLTRFKASEHGGEYLMRFISAWLCSLILILPFRPISKIFDKEYAGEAPYLLLILFFTVFYGLLTVLRFIPKLREMKTDCAALLISTAQFTVAYAAVMFREKGTNIDFFLGAVLFIALAVWYTVGKQRIRLPKFTKKCWIAVLALSAVFMLVFTALAMSLRYYKLCTPAFDFGIFTQMFENMKDGLGPVTTVERNYELSHFAVHFSPAYYLMLPFYMLFPHPVTLQILQGIFVTSGIIPVFLIARKYGFSLIHSSLFSAIYALYPAFTGGCSYDIHENCMLPALLLWLIWATEREKMIPMLVFALLTLTVKEDAAVYVAVIGLYLLLSDRSKRTRDARCCDFRNSLHLFLCSLRLSQLQRAWDYGMAVQGLYVPRRCAYYVTYSYGVYKSGLHSVKPVHRRKADLYSADARRTRRYTACKQEDSTLYITDTVCTGKSYADLSVSALDLFPVRFRLVRSCYLAFHNEYVGAVI